MFFQHFRVKEKEDQLYPPTSKPISLENGIDKENTRILDDFFYQCVHSCVEKKGPRIGKEPTGPESRRVLPAQSSRVVEARYYVLNTKSLSPHYFEEIMNRR